MGLLEGTVEFDEVVMVVLEEAVGCEIRLCEGENVAGASGGICH
jgi:hypothetical protein